MACSLKSDLRALKPLHYICMALALLPNLNENLEAASFHFVYPSMFILANVGSWMFSTYGKTTRLASLISLSVKITEVCSDLAITSCNILAIVSMCFINRRKIYAFYDCFKKLDENCKPFCSFIKCSEFRFIAELVIINIYFVIYYSFSSYTWISSVGFNTFKYFMSRDFQFYQLLMFTMILRYYALSIKYRFEILNQVLARMNRNYVSDDTKMFDVDVKWVKATYNSLCELVDQYNDIFGWQFIPIYVNILVNIIGPVNTAIVYGTGWATLNGFIMGWNLILLCTIWVGLPLIIGTAIFSACDQGEKEAQKIPKMCYLAAESLSEDEKAMGLKIQLEQFAQQAVNRKPEFSAAGFFSINYNIVFNLMGSISSYLIVLIQFNASDI